MDVDKVLAILKKSNKPMKSAEIAVDTGLDKTVVDKALAILKKEGKVNSPERCYYAAV